MSRRAYGALMLLACLQLAALLAGLPRLKGMAMASVASPLPRVFTVNDGLESFSSHYVLELRDADGTIRSLELTPELQARMRGPYNRRNAYGAVFAYGPVLATQPQTRAMFSAVSRHALCGEAPLLRELGIDLSRLRGPRTLHQRPRAGTQTALPLTQEITCP
ncbi:MAG: hypothetical protein QM778_17115 [Myxococcales bacterium]